MSVEPMNAGSSQDQADVTPDAAALAEAAEAARVLLAVWGEVGVSHHVAEYETTIRMSQDVAELARWRRVQQALRRLIGSGPFTR